jgi:FkbM family methyltransferase
MNLLNLFQKLDDYISYLNSNTVSEKSLLSKALGNKISLIDVGSNYGSYLSFISNNFSIEKAFVFEPSKTNYQYLKNKFKKFNYIIKPYATSNKNNQRMFYQYEITSMSSLYPDLKTYNSFNKIKNKYLVKVIKLDDFIKVKKIDLCKIDVQGEDLNTLKGMQKLLKKKIIKLIKIELSFEPIYGNNNDWIKIINFLNKYKYKLIGITKIKYKNLKIIFMDCYFIDSSIDY